MVNYFIILHYKVVVHAEVALLFGCFPLYLNLLFFNRTIRKLINAKGPKYLNYLNFATTKLIAPEREGKQSLSIVSSSILEMGLDKSKLIHI